MKDFRYFDKAFNKKNLSSYRLNIQFSKYGLEYAINDTNKNKNIALRYKKFQNPDINPLENLKKVIEDDAFLNKKYKIVNFFYVSKESTLVPAEFFDRKHLKSYFKYNYILKKDEELHFNYIRETDAYNIFSISSELIRFIINQFPEIKIYHYTSNIVKSSIKRIGEYINHYDYISVCFKEELMNIAIVKNKELVFLNNFNYQTEEDALFYIMSVVQKLLINLKKTEVLMQGNIIRDSKLHKYLLEYIPDMKFLTSTSNFPFDDIEWHNFANILDV